MNLESKGRGWPIPDAVNFFCELEHMLLLEEQHHFYSFDTHVDRTPGEVPLTARDGSVQVLRCLKVLFDLEEKVFFSAVTFLDHFLTKMKVQHKFLSCVTISCLHLASSAHNVNVDMARLVSVSQSRCSIKDLQRMSNIIKGKLMENETEQLPITVYDYLMPFLQIFERTSVYLRINVLYKKMIQYGDVLTRLEIIMASSACAYYRPTVITLALIQSSIEKFFSKEISKRSPYFSVEILELLMVIGELQQICVIAPEEFISCYQKVAVVLKEYDTNCKSCHRQKLVWRFSSCTLNACKPSENFYNVLCTIQEE